MMKCTNCGKEDRVRPEDGGKIAKVSIFMAFPKRGVLSFCGKRCLKKYMKGRSIFTGKLT